jgi:hypothetical protein
VLVGRSRGPPRRQNAPDSDGIADGKRQRMQGHGDVPAGSRSCDITIYSCRDFAVICLPSLVVACFSAVLVGAAPSGPGAGGGTMVIRYARRRRTSPRVIGMRPLPGLLGRSPP